MTIIIIVLAVIVILLLALYVSLFIYEDYLDMEEENERLSHLIEDCFWMQNDSLEAYREILSAACQESGFWENENDIVDMEE